MAKPTLIQAVIETYDDLRAGEPTLPEIWHGVAPVDGEFGPAAIFTHDGEVSGPEDYPTGSTKPSLVDGGFTVEIYTTGVVELEELAEIVSEGFTPSSIDIVGSTFRSLFRVSYKVSATNLVDATGAMLYSARLSYICKFNPPW